MYTRYPRYPTTPAGPVETDCRRAPACMTEGAVEADYRYAESIPSSDFVRVSAFFLPDCLPCRASFFVEQAAAGALFGSCAKPSRGNKTCASLRPPTAARAWDHAGVIVLAAAVLIGLVSCATPKPPPPAVNLSGFPPAFRDGYADGCQSAKDRAAVRRDAARYANDRQYALGWRDGFDICRKRRHS